MKKPIMLLMLVTLLLSACSAQNSLVGSWKLISYGPEGSTSPAVSGSQAGITFNQDGTVSGTSGCNSFGGEYKVKGDQITFSQLASTLMACDEPLMSQEGAMFKVLNNTATYKVDGDTLTITNAGNVLVFTSGEVQSYPYP